MRAYFIISLFVQTCLLSLIVYDYYPTKFSWLWENRYFRQAQLESELSSKRLHDGESKHNEGSKKSSYLLNNISTLEWKKDNEPTENQSKKHKKIAEIKLHFPGNDSSLDLVNVASKEFKNSYLRKKLNELRNIKIYVIIEFQNTITFKSLSKLKQLGFATVKPLNKNQYLRKKVAIFYVNYARLFPASRNRSIIKNIYIVSHFAATGLYQLDIKSLAKQDNITINIRLPYSKPERVLTYKKNNLVGIDNIKKQLADDYGSKTILSLEKNQVISFFSELRYKIDLLKNVESHIKIQGKKVFLKDYKRTMLENYPAIYQKFTKYSEKIVPSDYISSIARSIDKKKSFSEIWREIDQILDQEIKYDWKKRKLFFSGNLLYNNIKDMYMSASELGAKKKGACPERTSLEIAILRELGIAARSATRLYHIYTEIFIPNYGWATTSLTLNEIPLTKSFDENMAYFIYWEPDHPIKLQWDGYIYPSIID